MIARIIYKLKYKGISKPLWGDLDVVFCGWYKNIYDDKKAVKKRILNQNRLNPDEIISVKIVEIDAVGSLGEAVKLI